MSSGPTATMCAQGCPPEEHTERLGLADEQHPLKVLDRAWPDGSRGEQGQHRYGDHTMVLRVKHAPLPRCKHGAFPDRAHLHREVPAPGARPHPLAVLSSTDQPTNSTGFFKSVSASAVLLIPPAAPYGAPPPASIRWQTLT